MAEKKKPPKRKAANLHVIKVTVKTLKRKEQFDVSEETLVQDFKRQLSERFNTPPEQLSLIFAGEILQDQNTLVQHKVGDGSKVHLFIKSQRRPPGTSEPPRSDAPPGLTFLPAALPNVIISRDLPEQSLDLSEWNGQPEELVASCHELVAQTMETLFLPMSTLSLDASALNNNPLLLGFLIGVTSMNVLDLNATDMFDFVNEAQEQDVTWQELIREVMQNLLGDTEQVRQMILSIPQMQQLAEQNPEIVHILSNVDFLQEMTDGATSPAVMDEIIRNHDRALSNLESIPGGYSALQQLYQDIEDPILNAVQAQFQGGPPENKPPSGPVSPQARTENREPLPNPWAPQTNSSGDNLCNGSSNRLGPSYNLRPRVSKPETLQNVDSLPGSDLPPPQGRVQQPPPKLAKIEAAALLSNPRALQALLQMQMGLLALAREVPDFLQALSDPDVDPESMEDSEGGEESLSSDDSSSSSEDDDDNDEEGQELGSDRSKADKEEEPMEGWPHVSFCWREQVPRTSEEQGESSGLNGCAPVDDMSC
uniref:Uncharacterized protein n=1 Tax=Sphaerodactylus townsendi TaxID=933632 RepID=A0ACB8FGX7_9SAUR